MTPLEEFILKAPGEVLYSMNEKFITVTHSTYKCSGCRRHIAVTYNLETGKVVSRIHPFHIEKANLKKMIIPTKESILKAYTEGTPEIRKLVLTLYLNKTHFSDAELLIIQKDEEILALKEKLEKCETK